MSDVKQCPNCKSELVGQIMNIMGKITLGCNVCGCTWRDDCKAFDYDNTDRIVEHGERVTPDIIPGG